jgi:hypothetical protein
MTKLNKPIRRQADTMPAAYGISSQLVITLYPRGIIGLREAGRRASSEVVLDASELYVQAVRQRVARSKAEKRKAKLARKKSR